MQVFYMHKTQTMQKENDEKTTNVDISGLDKANLLSRLYNAACQPTWYEECDEIDDIRRSGFGYVKMIGDVIFYADFSGDTVNSYHYNKYAKKDNLFESVVADIRRRDNFPV